MLALLAQGHSLAGDEEIALGALAAEQFVLFPRELAPRLYDSSGSAGARGSNRGSAASLFTRAGKVGVLADVPVVALVPESVARGLPPGLVSVRISEPGEPLDTVLLWHGDAVPPAAAAFREIARSAFARPLASG